jgi:hypothetical protein
MHNTPSKVAWGLSGATPRKIPRGQLKSNIRSWITAAAFSLFLLVWIALLYSVLFSSSGNGTSHGEMHTSSGQSDMSWSSGNVNRRDNGGVSGVSARGPGELRAPLAVSSEPSSSLAPPSLNEVKRNLTTYLHTLHGRLGALASRTVDPEHVWETFFEVTNSLPAQWDRDNRGRFHTTRDDKSIFVSLGTYRDPYCPMTIKSLYHQAHDPSKIFVGLLQQVNNTKNALTPYQFFTL